MTQGSKAQVHWPIRHLQHRPWSPHFCVGTFRAGDRLYMSRWQSFEAAAWGLTLQELPFFYSSHDARDLEVEQRVMRSRNKDRKALSQFGCVTLVSKACCSAKLWQAAVRRFAKSLTVLEERLVSGVAAYYLHGISMARIAIPHGMSQSLWHTQRSSRKCRLRTRDVPVMSSLRSPSPLHLSYVWCWTAYQCLSVFNLLKELWVHVLLWDYDS